MSVPHPAQQALSDYASGKLDEDSAAVVETHVAECAECEVTLQALEAHDDTLVSGLREAEKSPPEIYAREAEYQRAIERAVNLAEVTAIHGQPTTIIATAASAADENLAKKLGPYELLAKLGEGGMGAVYRAQHEHLGKTVAIKILPANAMRDPALVGRFRREMKAVGALHHPNIVGAHDAGEANGVHFLVMEYVAGKDLASILKESGTFSVEQAIHCTLQAARGLEFAHRKGIVHRDIKPANLLLDDEGTLKILDMGLARLDDNAHNIAAQEGLTQSGQVMGTVDYMAPEQAFDTHRADAKADVYSLGCTLYRLLTGKNAYAGETIVQKILAHREKPIPSLRAARADVPAALDQLFQRMMAKQADDRIGMSEVVKELTALQASSSTSATESFHLEQSPAAALAQPGLQSGGGQKNVSGTWLAAGFGSAAALILLTIVFIIRDKDGNEIARVNGPDGSSVTVKPSEPPANPLEATKPAEDPSKNTPQLKDEEKNNATSSAAITDNLTAWEKEVAALPPAQQLEAFRKKMVELNPGFDGKLTGGFGEMGPRFEDNAVASLGFNSEAITDLRPIRVFKNLTKLRCSGPETNPPKNTSQFRNLNSLKGLRLTSLDCGFNNIRDLTPLQGMPLKGLTLSNNQIDDLTPLAGMRLTTFVADNCWRLRDLSPLRGMPLTNIQAKGVATTDFSFLSGMPLRALGLQGTSFQDVKLLEGMPLEWVDLGRTPITEISALGSCKKLTRLFLRQTKLDPADVAALRAKLPNCKIDWDAPAVIAVVTPSIPPRTPLPDGPAGELVKELKLPDEVNRIEMAPDGIHLAIVYRNMVQWRNMIEDKVVWEGAKVQGMGVNQLTVSPDGKLLAIAGYRQDITNTVILLRTSDGGRVNALNTPSGGQSAAFSPDSKQLALGLIKGQVQIIEVATGKVLHEMKAHLDSVWSIAYSPDGSRLVSGSGLGRDNPRTRENQKTLLRYWNPATGQELPEDKMPGDFVHLNLAYTSDGQKLVVGSNIFYTDILAADGRFLTAIQMPKPAKIRNALPTASNRYGVFGETAVCVADLDTGNHVFEFPDRGITRGMDVTPDGRFLITSIEKDSKISIHRLPAECAAANLPKAEPPPVAVAQKFGFEQPDFAAWAAEVGRQDAETQRAMVIKKLQELNPGYDGQETHRTQNNGIVELYFSAEKITDLSPVRALPDLKILKCVGSLEQQGALRHLTPLQGLKLERLEFYLTQVEDLAPLRGMPLTALYCSGTKITDLKPLAGMPLTQLWIYYNKGITDLSPLRGAPLKTLHCYGTGISDLAPLIESPITALLCQQTQITDLTPLRGKALTELNISFTPVTNLEPLETCASLKKLYLQETKLSPESIEKLQKALPNCKIDQGTAKTSSAIEPQPAAMETDEQWEARVAKLSTVKQCAEVRQRLIERNPGLTTKDIVTRQDHNQIVYLKIFPTKLIDLSPVRGFPKLLELVCADNTQKSEYTDLKPLQGMALKRLVISYSQVSDLSPIAKLPITDLVITATPVEDLGPVREMKLTNLEAQLSPVASLEPLRGMPLKKLWVHQSRVTDLTPIADCPITSLNVSGCKISDLNTLIKMPLQELWIAGTQVTDLTPIADCRLSYLNLDGCRINDLTPVKNMPLTTLAIANTPITDLSPVKNHKLSHLNMENAKVSDLSPLRGMPLKFIWCNGNLCTDHSPLKDLPLEHMKLNYKPERDKELLQAIPTLRSINMKSAKELLAEGESKSK